MTTRRLRILLVQLPIPPAAIMPVRGNVPLAAAYLKMYATAQGLGERVDIDILPFRLANTLSDEGLAREIAARQPDLLGFSCYLWNVLRSLHVATRARELQPGIRVIIGGPEVTADNDWLLHHDAIDFASIGEGEQTFCEFLRTLLESGNWNAVPTSINGLWVKERSTAPPAFRKPLPSLDTISSPYLCGLLDAADEELLLLETIRGCIFKCKFCYYPKSYDGLYFLTPERISANLRHARERGAKDVVLLDPTLNQRKNFDEFVKLLAAENPEHQFRYFGELRAEGITPDLGRLLRDANFTEVEIGLQSVDDQAQRLMDRRNNMRAFEKGVSSLLDAGIHVKIDLIIGLPGDTAASVREGVKYLRDSGLYSSVQVFQLAVLPGTAFRREAEELSLTFQPRPPYYVTRTPVFELGEMIELMGEVQAAFECEFDQLPAPLLDTEDASAVWQVNLDAPTTTPVPSADRAQAFTLWLQANDLDARQHEAAALAAQLLADNPHTTLQVVIEAGDAQTVTLAALETIMVGCQAAPSYLDRGYAFQPGRAVGAKRLVVLLPADQRAALDASGRLDELAQHATLVWDGQPDAEAADDFHDVEYVRDATGAISLALGPVPAP